MVSANLCHNVISSNIAINANPEIGRAKQNNNMIEHMLASSVQ